VRDRGSILIRDAQISEDSHSVVAVAFTASISGTRGEFRGHQPTDKLERHYLVWGRGWAKKLRRAVDQFADRYEQGIAEGQALEETWSGLAIKHFAARGGELAHLVSSVCLVCVVRRTRETRQTRAPDRLPESGLHFSTSGHSLIARTR
jgi:hypothetical protein